MDLRKNQWEEAYSRGNNYVFYPNEQVIRFVSKYIRKRVGVGQFVNVTDMQTGLDLGCGIGRHVIFLDEMNFNAFGIDLSEKAINDAKEWCQSLGKNHLINQFQVGSITDLPYENSYFDFVIANSVLDSMEYEIARKSIEEIYRVTKTGGLLIFDLVAGNSIDHPREYCGEEIVTSEHERGTVQSYYNWAKINGLIEGCYKIEEAILILQESIIKTARNVRYHLVARKI